MFDPGKPFELVGDADLSERSVLFLDHGLYVHFARTAGRGFGKAYYWTPWQREFPDGNSLSIGDGYPELERLSEWESREDEFDLVVALDLGFGATVERLRKAGRRVWGAGPAERLEQDRAYFRQVLESVGLPVQTAQWCHGIDDLDAYLRKHKEVYVKISTFRGAMETWHSADYETSRMRLWDLRKTMGARALVTDFLVEHKIDAVAEVGYDGYCIAGADGSAAHYPARCAFGYERKDAGYLGMIEEYDALPFAVREINEAMAEPLGQLGYRGMLSTEIRVAEDGTPYFTDITCRCPSPPTELTGAWYKNWPEILWEGAAGRVIDPEPVAKFGAEATIRSWFAEQGWLAVRYPDKIAKRVKLRNACIIEGIEYVAPLEAHLEEVGGVIGLGNSLLAACRECAEAGAALTGTGVSVDTDALFKTVQAIEEAREAGVEWNGRLPGIEAMANL